MSKIHNIPLLLLVFLSATAAMLCWIFGLSALSSPIMMGDVFVSKSIAGLAKDALFVPLKPLMYALIILSIGSSLAISTGGLGAKFIRVFSFFICFSLIGMAVGIGAFILFSGLDIGLALPKEGNGSGLIKEMPFLLKIYGVLTSALMISIYAGLVLGGALKTAGLGQQADEISDLFIRGFRKFLQYTIPLAVFGSITLALNKPGGFENLVKLLNLTIPYIFSMAIV